jgi:hypothetical protein
MRVARNLDLIDSGHLASPVFQRSYRCSTSVSASREYTKKDILALEQAD